MSERTKFCYNCAAFTPGSREGQNGVCRRHPPQSFMLVMPEPPDSKLLIQGKTVQAGPQLMFPSAFSQLQPTEYCFDHVEIEEGKEVAGFHA
jgi:hypothetical protein